MKITMGFESIVISRAGSGPAVDASVKCKGMYRPRDRLQLCRGAQPIVISREDSGPAVDASVKCKGHLWTYRPTTAVQGCCLWLCSGHSHKVIDMLGSCRLLVFNCLLARRMASARAGEMLFRGSEKKV